MVIFRKLVISCSFFLLMLYGVNSSSNTTRILLVVTREILLGHSKSQITINGTVPGPTIRVPIGNWVEVWILIMLLNHIINFFQVTVQNNLPDNKTTVHFHGINMHNTPFSDGAPFINQCPIPNVIKLNYIMYLLIYTVSSIIIDYYNNYHQLIF